ncbi:hypothetical protein B0H11DRAFT_2213719 [Mycena galericulata]|nr:hypothetical protein B0H11DRAFT_2213719 [Mycena galericulata]
MPSTSVRPMLTMLHDDRNVFAPLHAMCEDLASQAIAPLRALQDWQLAEDLRTAGEERALDLAVGYIPSPSPETETVCERYEREAREDADLELAVQRSIHDQQGSAVALPTSTRTPHLRPLSPTPDFPAHIPFTPALSRAVAPDATGAHGAPSSPITRPAPPPLRITTQLNETWMSSNGGPQIAGRTPAVSTRPETLHLRRHGAVSRRPVYNARQVQRFTLVYIDETDKAPVVRIIDDCPLWPSYVLGDNILSQLGSDIIALDWLSPSLGFLWVGISTTYVHTVSRDSVVVLRRRGISVADEKGLITTFYPTAKPLHLRYNATGERAALRKEYKTKGAVVIEDSDSEVQVLSDSEVEIVLEPRKRSIKQEPGGSPPRQRPRLVIDTSVPRAEGSSSSSIPPSSSSVPPSTTPATTPPTSPGPLPAKSKHLVWPRGQYTIDMAAGFDRMKSPALMDIPRPQRFKHAFGEQYTYHKGTYQENAKYWWAAKSPALKQEAIDAGRTPAGLWAEYRRRCTF